MPGCVMINLNRIISLKYYKTKMQVLFLALFLNRKLRIREINGRIRRHFLDGWWEWESKGNLQAKGKCYTRVSEG